VKLRLQGNSVRLRLMRSEVVRILAGDRVEESIRFSPDPQATLHYSLSMDSTLAEQASVQYAAGSLTVLLSEHAVKLWAADDQVGIYTSLHTGIDPGPDTGDGAMLQLSVEKDFACLDRDEKENQDTFKNPQTKHDC
jgi:hypothetical protein